MVLPGVGRPGRRQGTKKRGPPERAHGETQAKSPAGGAPENETPGATRATRAATETGATGPTGQPEKRRGGSQGADAARGTTQTKPHTNAKHVFMHMADDRHLFEEQPQTHT